MAKTLQDFASRQGSCAPPCAVAADAVAETPTRHELQLPFDEFWQAMRPSEPAPPSPNWPPELSRNLLVGMRQENEFIDALCLKYELG